MYAHFEKKLVIPRESLHDRDLKHWTKLLKS
jgi:hypothetical protein